MSDKDVRIVVPTGKAHLSDEDRKSLLRRLRANKMWKRLQVVMELGELDTSATGAFSVSSSDIVKSKNGSLQIEALGKLRAKGLVKNSG